MGYKAVYPEEAINGHRAFISRRRQLRPGEEYRTSTDTEWDEFLGHFERRCVVLGNCGRAYGTACIHERSRTRCSLRRINPVDLRDTATGLDSDNTGILISAIRHAAGNRPGRNDYR